MMDDGTVDFMELLLVYMYRAVLYAYSNNIFVCAASNVRLSQSFLRKKVVGVLYQRISL